MRSINWVRDILLITIIVMCWFCFLFYRRCLFYSMEGNQLFQQNYFSFGNGKIKRKIESLKSNINIEGDDIVYSYGAYNAGNYFYILYSGKH